MARAFEVRHAALVRLPGYGRLPAPVSAHADMLLFPLRDGRILTYREYADRNPGVFRGISERLVLTDALPGADYPDDVLLDALPVGDALFGLDGATAPELRKEFGSFVAVRQGYARCSVLMPGKDLALTADRGLCAELSKRGVKTLLIRPGGISLPGYDTGFIGGAAAVFPDGHTLFYGDITRHPDYREIKDFFDAHGVSMSFAAGEPLTDLGGALVLRSE